MSGPIISAGWVGRVIDGRFALHEWLGGTSTSGVFRTDLPQPVEKRAAIKLIPAEGAEADAYLAGWAKAANLSHPHLIRVHRSGRFQFGSIGMVYVVMECADEVLSQILPSRALTTDETREMLAPVMDALGYLHEKGFVHGHLKPSNILVINDQLKISGDNIDAGGMRNRFEHPTPYDAPEAGTGVLTPASDVWSLGMTLVEALTQRIPGRDGASTLDLTVLDDVPRTFAEIARDCLRRNPDERCSLDEIRGLLEPSKPILFRTKTETGAADVSASTEYSLEDAEESDPSKAKIRRLMLVVGAIAVVVLFAVLMMRGHGKQDATPSPGGDNSATSSEASTSATPVAATDHTTAQGDVMTRKMPEVTPQARRTIHGTVVMAVRVAVDSSGKVTDATLKSEGHSAYFAKVAMQAARGWTFKPAERNGQATSSHWVIRFKFRQRGDEAAAVEEKR